MKYIVLIGALVWISARACDELPMFTSVDLTAFNEPDPHIGSDIEERCMELGAVRGSDTDVTKQFEALGCCYNDGLAEPNGC